MPNTTPQTQPKETENTSTNKTFKEKQKIAQEVIKKFAPSSWWHLSMIALVIITASLVTFINYNYIVTSLGSTNSINEWIKAIFALLILASTITIAIYAMQTIWQRHKIELDEYKEFSKQVRDKLMNEELFK